MNINLTKLLHSAKDFILAQPHPIMVHQMGKVGSTTVCKSLRAAGIRPWHLHHVSRKRWESSRNNYYKTGQYDLPRHFYLDYMARKYLEFTNHRVKIISLVRDPIARRISSIFQVPDLHGIDIVNQDASSIARIIEKRLENTDASYVYTWFDKEFKRVHNYDIFENSFNQDEGYGIYASERADILIMQLEQLSRLISTHLSSFIGKPLQMVKANVGREKKRGSKYKRVKQAIKINTSICHSIYDNRWMRYFYTDDQIRAFVDRWTAPSMH
jgi:hypothetical protein